MTTKEEMGLVCNNFITWCHENGIGAVVSMTSHNGDYIIGATPLTGEFVFVTSKSIQTVQDLSEEMHRADGKRLLKKCTENDLFI